MRVLILTYPLTAVTEDACGGTEQVALHLLVRVARSPCIELHWMGAAGSADIPGACFYPWPAASSGDLQAECAHAAIALARRLQPQLVHSVGAFVWREAGEFPAPVLFSLHLARRLYPPDFLAARPINLHYHCVSRTQAREYGPVADYGVIANGIPVERFTARTAAAAADAPLLFLGRICEEKAPDAAITIARLAQRPLQIVGEAAPFPAHQRYFRERVAPQVGRDGVEFMPPPPFAGKLRLLDQAAAVVIPSRIDETSSLVAMEAASAGVPVIARRRGALPEVVADGVTGWLGDTDAELAAAAARLGDIDPAACRQRAERRFQADRMAAETLRRYEQLQ